MEGGCWASEGCHRTAGLEDALDIDDARLSSKDEGLEMLSFAAWGKGVNFGYFGYPKHCDI